MYRRKDPTADIAIGNVIREQKQKLRSDRRKAQRKANRQARQRTAEYKNCQKVYVVSPYAGDIQANTAAAIRYCQYVITQGKQPIASHLLYPQMLDDNDLQERELGLLFGLSLLALCNEVWVFGTTISAGMRAELLEARRLGKPIRKMEEAVV